MSRGSWPGAPVPQPRRRAGRATDHDDDRSAHHHAAAATAPDHGCAAAADYGGSSAASADHGAAASSCGSSGGRLLRQLLGSQGCGRRADPPRRTRLPARAGPRLGWRRLRVAPALAAALVAALSAGCGPSDDGGQATAASAPPTFAAPTTPPPTFASVTTAPTTTSAASGTGLEGQIAALTVAPEGPRDGYDRGLFVQWIDADNDGCDTRCEVLESERRDDLPGLARGGWLSIYDGYSTDDPSELDIDHLVPLAEAWDSGAAAWDAARRQAFANDLDDPGTLIAVTAATNRSKGDRDPADWQPPNRAAWCEYVASWVSVKLRWGLTADDSEVHALQNMARGC